MKPAGLTLKKTQASKQKGTVKIRYSRRQHSPTPMCWFNISIHSEAALIKGDPINKRIRYRYRTQARKLTIIQSSASPDAAELQQKKELPTVNLIIDEVPKGDQDLHRRLQSENTGIFMEHRDLGEMSENSVCKVLWLQRPGSLVSQRPTQHKVMWVFHDGKTDMYMCIS